MTTPAWDITPFPNWWAMAQPHMQHHLPMTKRSLTSLGLSGLRKKFLALKNTVNSCSSNH